MRNCLLQAISPRNVFHSYIDLSSMRQNAVLCGNGLIQSDFTHLEAVADVELELTGEMKFESK